jgi:hypothetical protein
MVFEVEVAHFGVEVSQLLTTYVSASVVGELDSGLTVGFDDVRFYLGPAF